MSKLNTAFFAKTIAGIMKDLSTRNRDIVSRRFGLRTGKPETLESIGSSYGITRERVRQIEASAISQLTGNVRENKEVAKYVASVVDVLHQAGGVIHRDELLQKITGSAEANVSNASLAFILSLSDEVIFHEESDQFHPFWAVSREHAKKFKDAAVTLAGAFERNGAVVDQEQLPHFASTNSGGLLVSHLASVMSVSKELGANIFGEVGLRQWAEVRPRGVRDKAYLVMKKQGAPRHFSEIAKLINSASFSSGRTVNTQTVHNELIKDKRFVLVGRGLYALADWGYKPGTVREVLVDVLKGANKPMSRAELVSKVLKSRMVKENTILLNLQDSRCFAKHEDGTYTLRKA